MDIQIVEFNDSQITLDDPMQLHEQSEEEEKVQYDSGALER
jgi:hypothetical protein